MRARTWSIAVAVAAAISSAGGRASADNPSGKGIVLQVEPGGSGWVDFDGDGKVERLSVAEDGSSVSAGMLVLPATARPPANASDAVVVHDVAVLDLGGVKRGKLLALRYTWDEDEAGWTIFEVRGPRAAFVGEVPPGAVAGNGSIVVTSWDCGVTSKTTFVLGRRGFVVKGRTHTGKRDLSKCAG